MPVSTSLPLKENSLFKRAMKCYENKQYKNGVKFVNQLLSNPKFSDHGETLALKGLMLYWLGKREEAYDLVRKGLKMELKSFLCWHTYGILNRSDKNYDEAIKCYRNALRCESGNIQALQDLSVLQVQTRDLEGFLESRAKLFQVVPTQRAAWAGFAVAYHLNKDYSTCLQILDTFRKTLSSSSNVSPVEYNELLLYENMVIEESGDINRALEHLNEYQSQILDKVALLENFVRLYLSIRNYEEAKNHIDQLIFRNPERTTYYYWLFEALQLKTDDEKFNTLVQQMELYPRARVPRRMTLEFVHDEKFKVEIEKYLKKELRRGVPPLFVDIRGLYKDKKKIAIIENIVLNYEKSLMDEGVLGTGTNHMEPPTTLLWVYYFLAQHYCHLSKFKEAIDYIDLALVHTPTLPDLYINKGKIYKKAGNPKLASDWLMEAQALDTSDRFINSKCACYLLQSNKIETAIDIVSLFSVDNKNVVDGLSEIQCIWFQLECALAYERLGMYGDALKKCHEIDNHFTQFYQDQFDFHSYCLRGLTLRPYIFLLRFEEELRGHSFYKKAAHCAIRIYLKLYDSPKTTEKVETKELDKTLTSSELKKLKNKERKARKKAEMLKASGDERTKPEEKNVQNLTKSELNPDNLRNTPTPLEDAIKFLLFLKMFSSKDILTHIYAFEIYYRKEKVLLMLQAIKRGFTLDSNNGLLHEAIVRFTLLIKKKKAENQLSYALAEVIDKQMEDIWRGRTPEEINDDFINRNGNSLEARLHAARAMYLIDSAKQARAIELCTCIEGDLYCDVSVKVCASVQDYLKCGSFGPCESEINQYSTKCNKIFPLASVFMSSDSSELIGIKDLEISVA